MPTCAGSLPSGAYYCATNSSSAPKTGLDKNYSTTLVANCPNSPGSGVNLPGQTCQVFCPSPLVPNNSNLALATACVQSGTGGGGGGCPYACNYCNSQTNPGQIQCSGVLCHTPCSSSLPNYVNGTWSDCGVACCGTTPYDNSTNANGQIKAGCCTDDGAYVCTSNGGTQGFCLCQGGQCGGYGISCQRDNGGYTPNCCCVPTTCNGPAEICNDKNGIDNCGNPCANQVSSSCTGLCDYLNPGIGDEGSTINVPSQCGAYGQGSGVSDGCNDGLCCYCSG